MRPLGIYIHIPFCVRKCLYCDFVSHPIESVREMECYCAVLRRDIIRQSRLYPGYRVRTIYLGGGTPSLLSGTQLKNILQRLRRDFAVSLDAEITLEMNPATVSEKTLRSYKKAGVNRISLGVQSFHGRYLKVLGRAHTVRDAHRAFSFVRNAGFDNISIDLMYGLPCQSVRDWNNDLSLAIKENPEHISFYDLTLEKGTPLSVIKKTLSLPDEQSQIAMYTAGCNRLQAAGYRHYEISSFAKPGKESRHNRIYWCNEEYLGVGAAAFSYMRGVRFRWSNNVQTYEQQVQNGRIRRYARESLDPRKRAEETIMLNLRLLAGFSLAELKKREDMIIDEQLLARLRGLVEDKLITGSGSRFRLTKRGILLYNTVAERILGD